MLPDTGNSSRGTCNNESGQFYLKSWPWQKRSTPLPRLITGVPEGSSEIIQVIHIGFVPDLRTPTSYGASIVSLLKTIPGWAQHGNITRESNCRTKSKLVETSWQPWTMYANSCFDGQKNIKNQNLLNISQSKLFFKGSENVNCVNCCQKIGYPQF